jgi:uncharacterized membrane protein
VYRYRVARPGAGFGVSAAAGLFSGLLGVGGGFIKVPAMNILMRVPMKAAVATSNFMIGVTAAASAFIYYSQGLVDPSLAAMVIIGVFTGTNLGTRLLVRAKAENVRFVFAIFLAALGIAMAARALGFPGGRMIAARAGIRLVQHRITALRRAVVSEVEDTNRLIYHILRGGVLLSVAVLLFGFVLVGIQGSVLPNRSVPPRSLIPQLVAFTPAGYLSLGVLVLIFTPVARVVLSLLSFAEDRDRTYVLMTAIVLVNLLVSVFLLA